MEKRGNWWVVLGILMVLLFVLIAFLYFSLKGPNYEKRYEEQERWGEIQNPVSQLNDSDAVASFNESFIWYLLFNIKAYNLHNPPLSSDEPKIQIYVGEVSYYSIIREGEIEVAKGEIDGKDIILRTNAEETVKMIRDKNYIQNSFSAGNSKVELIASKSTLFAKGYLNLYSELTGKSVSGNVIRIYSS